MSRLRTALISGATVVVVAGGLIAAGAVTGGGSSPSSSPSGMPSLSTDPLTASIQKAQYSLQVNPNDAGTWASLGLSYISQAKITSDPSYYAKATGAVQKSLAIDTKVNYEGYASLAALKNAEHDFRAGRAAALKGIAIDGSNSTLYGALGDSDTQLGNYAQAAKDIDMMNQLLPGVAAFTRASYVFELRGDVANAKAALVRALDDANSGSDRGFAQYYLGELALHYGQGAQAALALYKQGVTDSPTEASLLAGQAKAEAAAGMTADALRDYATVVAEVPQPQYVLEYGELLQSMNDPAYKQQYSLFTTEEKLFTANGVTLDVEPTLFEADHGDAKKALALGASGWAARPFVEMADARAWAFYVNKQYAQALVWSKKAFASGWSPSLELFHRGMIEKALGMKGPAKADLAKALKQEPLFSPLQAPVARKALAELN